MSIVTARPAAYQWPRESLPRPGEDTWCKSAPRLGVW